MIISWNEVKRLNSLRMFRVFLICSHLQKNYLSFSDCSLSKSRSRSSILFLYPGIPKRARSDFSITHIPCQQRRNQLNTRYTFVNSEIMIPQNSMDERICRGHLQATRGLDVSIHPSPLEPGLSPSHLLYMENFT